MNVGKKKLKELQGISVYDAILRESGHEFTDDQPETWRDYQREAFDMLVEVEHRMHKEFLRILES